MRAVPSQGRNVQTDNRAVSNGGTIFNSIDDLEHNNLSGVYNGDTSSFNIQTNTVINGTYTLRADTASNDTIYGTEASGLNFNPVRGEEFSFSLRFANTQDYVVGAAFAVQSTTTAYVAGINPGSSVVFVSTIDALDSSSPSSSTSGSFSVNTNYNITVDFGKTTSSDITATVTDDTGSDISATLTDSTYDSGDAGWHQNPFGNVTITAYADDAQ